MLILIKQLIAAVFMFPVSHKNIKCLINRDQLSLVIW